MAGITDRQFRLLLRRHGAIGLVSMEFISSEGIKRKDRRTLQALHFVEEERPLSIQIYGRDPETMAEAARIVESIGADVCDINMGCPANKILKGCAGASLMGDLPLATAIVRACRKALTIPLTVKFRAGLKNDSPNDLELGRICQEEGVDGVALHPRTAEQKYTGKADWTRIRALKKSLTIPVVGNGDIGSAEDALRMIEETGCDGVMIGRTSMVNPWIYRQIRELLAGTKPTEPTLADRRQWINDHFELLLEQEEPLHALHKLRLFTGWYTRGLPQGRKLRQKIGKLETSEAFLEALDTFFEQAGVNS